MRKGEAGAVIIIGLLLTILGSLIQTSVDKDSSDNNTTKESR